jgi:hypothetical protein
MAKIDLKFLDEHANNTFIKCERLDFGGEGDTIFISGVDDEMVNDDIFMIQLDKSTAIRFAKTLRTEINKMES